MTSALNGALATMLAGCLAFAALADGATRLDSDTYNGWFRLAGPHTGIRVDVRVVNGEAKSINSVEYSRLPATCPSGLPLINGRWTFTGLRVNLRRKFRIAGTDHRPNPSSLRFKGRFSKNFNKVRGKFRTSSYFPEKPDGNGGTTPGTCVSKTKRYSARR